MTFAIADFGFWIEEKKHMKEETSLRLPNSCSYNPKSAIQNPKWLGIFTIVLTFVLGGAVASAQQQTKVSRIGWLSARGASNIGQETIVGMLRDLGYVEGKNIAFE
jgi:hypothetical protein